MGRDPTLLWCGVPAGYCSLASRCCRSAESRFRRDDISSARRFMLGANTFLLYLEFSTSSGKCWQTGKGDATRFCDTRSRHTASPLEYFARARVKQNYEKQFKPGKSSPTVYMRSDSCITQTIKKAGKRPVTKLRRCWMESRVMAHHTWNLSTPLSSR